MFDNNQDELHNRNFFRAGDFSWNYGTWINSHLQHEKEGPLAQNSHIFFQETLNWKASSEKKTY